MSLRVRFAFLLVLGLVLGLLDAGAQILIANPGFAERETFRYTETIGKVSRPFDVTLTHRTDAPARYELRSVGVDLESTYRLDPTNLLSLSSEMLTKSPEVTVFRSSEYRNPAPKLGPDDLVVTDMGSLPAVLRGFPWGRKGYAKLVYLGNTSYSGSAISFELQVLGRETIDVAGKRWECWHATTGLAGALGLVMAKTDWWFAVDGSHPLIRTSGPSGGPGSPTRTLSLESWVVGN